MVRSGSIFVCLARRLLFEGSNVFNSESEKIDLLSPFRLKEGFVGFLGFLDMVFVDVQRDHGDGGDDGDSGGDSDGDNIRFEWFSVKKRKKKM